MVGGKMRVCALCTVNNIAEHQQWSWLPNDINTRANQ